MNVAAVKPRAASLPAQHLIGVVGENIRAERLRAGISQWELGRRAGVSGPMITQIEGGSKNTTIATLADIASALGVSVTRLVKPPRSAVKNSA